MPEVTLPPMPADFPLWYREFLIDANTDRLQKRWAGVSSLVPMVDNTAIENLLRIVFGGKSVPSPEALGKIRQALKSADALFDLHGNDREVEVLSGVILAVLLDRNDDISARAAVAITTSALDGERALNLPMNLITLAENAITRIAENKRERPDLQSAKLDVPAISFATAKDRLATIDAAGIGGTFDGAAEAINAALKSIVMRFNSAIDATADFVTLQDEELNMLWWVLGERSDGIKKTFAAIPERERPLIFGSELAETTAYLPGPLSIEGLLARAGLKSDQALTIPDTVNACAKSWLQSISMNALASPLSQPIHFAIQRKLETGDETSWVSAWATICGIDATSTFAPLTLGKLFYRERLLFIF